MVAALRRAGFGIAPIAEAFGIGLKTVHRILVQEGVPTKPRRKLTSADRDEIRNLHDQGWTYTAIAARFGISRHRVAQIVATPRGES